MSAVPIPEGNREPHPAAVIVPLAEIDTQALIEFADELAAVPRYFGSGAIPRPSLRWRSMLSHPAAVNGVAALVGGELVGVARMSVRPVSGVAVGGATLGGATLVLAVATQWRRRGIGSALVEAAVTLAAHQNAVPVVALVEHRKAAVQALADRYHLVLMDAPVLRLAS